MARGFFSWYRPAPMASRRAAAERRVAAAARRGTPLSPVTVAGRTIAHTFWGRAWCGNLERYRDFAYRLERGRSYLRAGAVIDLRVEPGQIRAQVIGSTLYEVAIEIAAVAPAAWAAIRRDCAGGIASRLELLAGELSEAVMARLCAERIGLFPAPSEIRFECSCPDYAVMCKHVAAVMYGVGARLDQSPALLFELRRTSIDDLVTAALSTQPGRRPARGRVLATAGGGLGELFGIELAEPADAPKAPKVPKVTKAPKVTKVTKAPKARAPKPRAPKPRAPKPRTAGPRSPKPRAPAHR